MDPRPPKPDNKRPISSYKYNKPSIALKEYKVKEGVGGAGGIRTLVQTSNYNAFYMFSFHLDFRGLAGRKLPTHPLSLLEFHRHIKAL